MVDLLVSKPAVVLEDVVVLGTDGFGDLLERGLDGKSKKRVSARRSGIKPEGRWRLLGRRSQRVLSRTTTSVSWSSGMSVSLAP